MADPKLLKIIKQGAIAWNEWRRQNPFEYKPDLSHLRLRGLDLRGQDLSGADLRCVNLRGLDFMGETISDVDFGGADLTRVWAVGACFRNVDFSGALLTNANLNSAELAGVNLSNVDLTLANLIAANLERANLTNAILSSADLTHANLTGAILERADLAAAHLDWANLSQANLTHSYLGGVSFNGTKLSGADVSDASVKSTTFGSIDLTSLKGLESLRHEGPSSIGIDTIFESRGDIPEVFLRGADVPDALIAYINSMARTTIEFHSCFISYSTQDQDFANRLHSDLQYKGVRLWFAPHDIQGGKKVHEQIDEAIRHYDRLLLILSENSMKSTWVKAEIDNAVFKERNEGRRVLFPISIVPFGEVKKWQNFNPDLGMDLAKEIREYFIPDFSQWKEHDSYIQAFERLLRDLKAT